MHYLFYSRVIRHLYIKRKNILLLPLVINIISVFGYLLSRYFVEVAGIFYYIFSLSIGIGFILFFSWIIYEVIHLIQKKVPLDESKREFLKKGSDFAFISLGAGYISNGVFNDETTPKVIYTDVNQKRFNKPYKIAQLSDLHIGGIIGLEFIQRCVDLINKENVDIVVITGDLIDTKIEKSKIVVDELKRLRSKYGTFYVVGNHEYFHGVFDIMQYLKSIGINVLQNSSQKIDEFYIVGLYDLFGYRYGTYRPDVKKAFENIDTDVPTLLLMHQPKGIYELKETKPSLILSGHTHGGQIWPFGYLVRMAQPYLKGLYPLKENRHIYVNRGVGFWGPPMRVGSQAEITIISWS